MYKKMDDYDFIAIVYYNSVNCYVFDDREDIFDFHTMILHDTYHISCINDLKDIANDLYKNGNMVVAADVFYTDCNKYKSYRITGKGKHCIFSEWD